MDRYKSYKKRIITRAIVIPLSVTILTTMLLVAAAPAIEDALPNASAQQTQEEQL